MTTNATIRNIMRALVAGLLAACLSAAWPLSAQAGKSGGGSGGGSSGRVDHSSLTIQKHVDKATPKLYEATSRGKHFDNATIESRKGSTGGGGNVAAKWSVAQGAAAKTTGTKGKQQYIKYELKDTYISH